MPKRWSRLIAASILIGGVLLATGSVAVAAPVTPSFTITADRASAIPAGHRWAFNDFFPRTATIATGGTLQFMNEGFHTATVLPTSWSVAADLDVNGIIAADIDDSARNPNGTTKSLENIGPVLPVPAQGCGTAETPCVFDGTAIVSMGAPLAGPPAPFVVTVTAPPGSYAFHCRVHPLMKGTLTVVAAGAAGTTTAASADAAAATQATEDIAAGMQAETASAKGASVKRANGTTLWKLTAGTSDPAGRVAVLDMLPRKVTIRPGDSVVWRPRDRNEPHTVTFPNNRAATRSIPLCEGPGGKDTPAIPTVNPPVSPFDFACNGHPVDEFEFTGGNGVTAIKLPTTVSDSGVVAYRTEAAGFDVPATATLSSWTVSFAGAKAGTYTYVCLVHEGMTGTIVVR
jgi:plastocyanin